MIFAETDIPGVFEISLEPRGDDRGFFARSFCTREFAEAGIDFSVAQANISRNTEALTLRGMHWQDAPFEETKVVRAISGSCYDVVVDLRPGKTWRRWIARVLDADHANALYIPKGCAHGFLTLEPMTDLLYLMGSCYVPGHARGFPWHDPEIDIAWPHEPDIVSQADSSWPLLAPAGIHPDNP